MQAGNRILHIKSPSLNSQT